MELARSLTAKDAGSQQNVAKNTEFMKLGDGRVRFVELDAEKMGDFFRESEPKATFDCV